MKNIAGALNPRQMDLEVGAGFSGTPLGTSKSNANATCSKGSIQRSFSFRMNVLRCRSEK